MASVDPGRVPRVLFLGVSVGTNGVDHENHREHVIVHVVHWHLIPLHDSSLKVHKNVCVCCVLNGCSCLD